VTPEICSTIPRATASRASSSVDQRDSGTPCSAGSSHASAITSARTCGGESRGPAPPRSVLEPGHAVLEEALAPLGDNLAAAVQPLRDLIIA